MERKYLNTFFEPLQIHFTYQTIKLNTLKKLPDLQSFALLLFCFFTELNRECVAVTEKLCCILLTIKSSPIIQKIHKSSFAIPHHFTIQSRFTTGEMSLYAMKSCYVGMLAAVMGVGVLEES